MVDGSSEQDGGSSVGARKGRRTVGNRGARSLEMGVEFFGNFRWEKCGGNVWFGGKD